MNAPRPLEEAQSVRDAVRQGYATVAASESCSPKRSCCGAPSSDADQLAHAIGYSASDLAAVPAGANMGLSCGNPNALAALKPGEAVLDLGSGGGFDAFIAGRKVGPAGRVIGVDMTPEMIAKARRNIAQYRQHTGLENVEFRLGEIEHLPVADASVDVVISNCVINLSPDKPQVWREIARALKPGGRVAVSDLALLRPLPPEIAGMVEALVGCVAGAVLVSDTQQFASDAGLADIHLVAKSDYIAAMVQGEDPLYQKIIARLPAGMKPEDFITSLEISARKPASEQVRKPYPKVRIYDPAMCCPTGVCGPAIDPKLIQFSSDVEWLKQHGVVVERFNLSQNPAAFAENPRVRESLERSMDTLPIVLVDDTPLSSGVYPTRAELARALGITTAAISVFKPLPLAPLASGDACCSPGTSKCC